MSEPSPEIVSMLSTRYGDFVIHLVDRPSNDAAMQFLLGLPFVSDGRTPDHIQCATTEPMFDGSVAAVIGGQLTRGENLSVRRMADSVGAECRSLCTAREGSETERAFLAAGLADQERRSRGKAGASGKAAKPWWKFW